MGRFFAGRRQTMSALWKAGVGVTAVVAATFTVANFGTRFVANPPVAQKGKIENITNRDLLLQ